MSLWVHCHVVSKHTWSCEWCGVIFRRSVSPLEATFVNRSNWDTGHSQPQPSMSYVSDVRKLMSTEVAALVNNKLIILHLKLRTEYHLLFIFKQPYPPTFSSVFIQNILQFANTMADL